MVLQKYTRALLVISAGSVEQTTLFLKKPVTPLSTPRKCAPVLAGL
jgi:hypothetical protein